MLSSITSKRKVSYYDQLQDYRIFDRVVPLSQCVLGTVIAMCDLTSKNDKSKFSYYHLVGFSKNSQGELILALQYFGTDSESTKM